MINNCIYCMNFYDYLKARSKPKHIKLATAYVETYNLIKTFKPTMPNYLLKLDEATKKLKLLENQIEENGGIAIAGVVSYKNKAIRKFIKKK